MVFGIGICVNSLMLIGLCCVVYDLIFAISGPYICRVLLASSIVINQLRMVFFSNVLTYFRYLGAPNSWCISLDSSTSISLRLVKFSLLADTKARNE